MTADNPGVIARPPLIYGGGLILVLVLRWLWPMPIFAGDAMRWAGLALVVLSLALGLWGRATMLAVGTNIDPMRPTTAIVASGPFRLTRNPLYVGFALLFLGLTLALDTWWGVIALFPLVVVMHFGVVLREERYLEGKFGDDYRRYKARVARYVLV